MSRLQGTELSELSEPSMAEIKPKKVRVSKKVVPESNVEKEIDENVTAAPKVIKRKSKKVVEKIVEKLHEEDFQESPEEVQVKEKVIQVKHENIPSSGNHGKNENIPNIDSYNMYFRTVQSGAIKTLSEALKEVLSDVNMHFDSSGIRIMTMDTNRAAFVHLKLDAEKFDNYHCPRQFSIGVGLISLHKLLKTIHNSDIVSFYIHKNDTEKLCIKIENKEKKITSESKLKLLDLDDQGLSIPSVTFEHIFNMPCVDFQKHCRDLSTLADTVKISVKSNGEVFTMFASGDFADQEIRIGEDSSEITSEEKIYIGEYPIKYLNLICKASGLCPSIEICLRETYPILLHFSVANLGSVRFGISPKHVM